jgi:hypothetical protein
MEDKRIQFLFDNISVVGNIEDKNSLSSSLNNRDKNRSVQDFLDDVR